MRTEEERDLDRLLEEAIEEGLNVLGKSGKQMLFFHLEKTYSVKKHEITQKSDAFAAALREIFGAGASVLEKLILKNVYFKLGLEYQEKKKYAFSDYLREVTVALEQQPQDSNKIREELDESLQVTY